MMDLQRLLREIVTGFARGVGYRAAYGMPWWVILVLLVVALAFGVQW